MNVIILERRNVSFSADALANYNNNNEGRRIKTRSFVFSPTSAKEKPKLVLIGGSAGTGKSTFGMSVALDQGILKCISTDTIRGVMRSFIPKNISPALHRSSYEHGNHSDDPVNSWYETVRVIEGSVEGWLSMQSLGNRVWYWRVLGLIPPKNSSKCGNKLVVLPQDVF